MHDGVHTLQALQLNDHAEVSKFAMDIIEKFFCDDETLCYAESGG